MANMESICFFPTPGPSPHAGRGESLPLMTGGFTVHGRSPDEVIENL